MIGVNCSECGQPQALRARLEAAEARVKAFEDTTAYKEVRRMCSDCRVKLAAAEKRVGELQKGQSALARALDASEIDQVVAKKRLAEAERLLSLAVLGYPHWGDKLQDEAEAFLAAKGET